MTRSRKKVPVTGTTTAESDKWFKRSEHRRERASVRIAMSCGDELPHPKAFGNPWSSAKDGKAFWTRNQHLAIRK